MKSTLARWALIHAACLCLLAGCVTNPTTGRRSFEVLSLEEEIQIGQQEGPKFTAQNGGEVPDPALRAYVSELGMRIAAQVETDEQRNLPWKFTLLNSDQINAFALPGGQVFFSMGLARLLKSEAEMAGVLGHEVAHVTARHINEQLSRDTWAQVLAGVVGVAAGDTAGQITAQGSQLVLLSYSRGQESEADRIGMRYMARAGYNPIGQKRVMEVLLEASKGGHPPEFFSTHPNPATRVQDIQKWIDTDEEFASWRGNTTDGLFGDRFRQRFLSRIARSEAGEPAMAGLDLSKPATWCAHCRINAELEALEHQASAP